MDGNKIRQNYISLFERRTNLYSANECIGNDGETALHCAAARGHTECVQSLLEAGAPVDDVDQDGQTALHLALRRSHIDIALLLITKGCKLDIQDENGETALHIACRLGLLSAVQTLCHLGASVDIPNTSSLTALHIAAKEGYIEIVRCLCFFGANVLKKNKDGLTAEIIALAQEHTNIGNLLAKMKTNKDLYVEQLCPLESLLKRIKLKVFGHSGTGKSRLVCSLQSNSVIGTLIGAVSRRFSDNPSPSSSTASSSKGNQIFEMITSVKVLKKHHTRNITSTDESIEANNNHKVSKKRGPPHLQYTRGIDVQNIALQGCGEFSVWEFGGYEPYHMTYDHFVGNTDCIHMVVFRSTDPTEVQYKQVLYWMNFLKGRVTPSEPIGHCGIVSRRSKVVIVGTHANATMFPQRGPDGEYISSDGEAMLKTVRLRFETHFDIHDQLILLDSTHTNCPGMKSLRAYLSKAREAILSRLQKPMGFVDASMQCLTAMRKQYCHFPVVTWPSFTEILRNEINPLAGDNHCRQLIQQLQLIGEVVYLRDETSELDYVVLSPEWLGTHIIGYLLSAEFLSRCRTNGCYSVYDFSQIYPEISDPADLLRILDTLQFCAPLDTNGETELEFPAFNVLEVPRDIWLRDRPSYVYGGVRVLPMRGMERSLQSTFPRIQVALRRSMRDFQDPMDADLSQWLDCSKMSSGQMEALIRLHGDAVEVQVRGPCELATSCFYFLEDITNLVEQTAQEVAPGISLERHFLSPKHLREHNPNPAVYAPEPIMAMQQAESLTIKNNQEGEEYFTDVVCFGSRDVAAVLTLGIDVSVAQLQLASRCELAALLDPADAMGRDWSILAVKLSLMDQLPEVDSTGQSLSRTDQLLAEWALQCPEAATVGRLCSVLEELGRQDARDALYRTVPLYLFAPLDEQPTSNITECRDSGVVSSTQSTTDPRSTSTLSR
uniref:Non-specific serine/threonine protein kinase n=1 Tax=Syphacia muris TaxID=451379 RepID=A0A0N5A9F4_9BILA